MILRNFLLFAAAFFALTLPCIQAATITVTNTADTGLGSLRQAITSASSGTNTIVFNIPGSGVQTILAKTALPNVAANTTIDGYSQPGSRTNSLVNGNDAILLIELRPGALLSVGGLTLGNGCTVRGLVINGFYSHGIRANGNAIIEGNFIGTDSSGTVGLGNHFYGVFVAAENGSITVTLDGERTSLPLPREHQAMGAHFNRFGLITTHTGGNGQHIYFDDMTYTWTQRAKN